MKALGSRPPKSLPPGSEDFTMEDITAAMNYEDFDDNDDELNWSSESAKSLGKVYLEH